MNNTEKKELYESIMKSVSVIVKKAINEDLTPDKKKCFMIRMENRLIASAVKTA